MLGLVVELDDGDDELDEVVACEVLEAVNMTLESEMTETAVVPKPTANSSPLVES